jgi:hypothetical protein
MLSNWAILFTFVAASTLQGAINVSLTSDFSSVSNPNSEWNYVNDTNGTAAGGLATIGTSRSQSGLSGWSNASSLDGSVMQITNATQLSWKDGQNGDVVVHSSEASGTTTGFIWTSSEIGVVDITGQVWDALHDTGRNSSWALYINNTLIAERSAVFGLTRDTANANFANNTAVGASLDSVSIVIGDTISFYTEATTALGHFSGVELEITQVPEPAAVALILGSLGLFLAASRRRCI